MDEEIRERLGKIAVIINALTATVEELEERISALEGRGN